MKELATTSVGIRANIKKFSEGVSGGHDKRMFALSMLTWMVVNWRLILEGGTASLGKIDQMLRFDLFLQSVLVNLGLFVFFVVVGYIRGHAGSRSVVRGEGFKMAELARKCAAMQVLFFGAGLLASGSSLMGAQSALLIRWSAWSNFHEILGPFLFSLLLGSALIYLSGVVNFRFK